MRQFPYELIGTNSGTNNGTNRGTNAAMCVGNNHSNMQKYTKINPSWINHTIFEENSSISMSSKIFVKIHAILRKLPYCPCALLPMCPIAHVPHPPTHPQGPPSLSAVLTSIPFTHVPHCPCAPLLMCPIAHVPHCSCVKNMSSCQKDVKLSKRCQMSKNQTHKTMEEVHKKNKLT